jgi:tRNA dimethylallyltransferase
MKIKVVLLFGPTGASKSSTAIKLAYKRGEIISADSMQVYKNMDIGTAKVNKDDLKKVNHHLIDIVDPDNYFSVHHFYKRAFKVIKHIHGFDRVPFVVGGTGLYFKVLMQGGLVTGLDKDNNIRERLDKVYTNKGADCLYSYLKEVDYNTAIKLSKNDKKRIIRALEVYELTGRPMSAIITSKEKETPFSFLKIGLTMDRELLYNRINKRCDDMLANGFIREVTRLKDHGYSLELTSMQAIGYKHIYQYLNGGVEYNEMVRLFKRDTRRFAKRQWTLFNRFENVNWFHPDQLDEMEELIKAFIG